MTRPQPKPIKRSPPPRAVTPPPPPPARRVSLAEFAASQRPTTGATERWFQQHPDARAEVDAANGKYPVTIIWRWLRAHYQFPLTDAAVRAYYERLARSVRPA